LHAERRRSAAGRFEAARRDGGADGDAMPRRREVPRRKIQPDAKYNDRMVGRFANVLMSHGKKSTAEGILYGAFEMIESKTRNDPLQMFRRALDNVRPRVEVKSRRVGGATYQVPVEVRPERANSLAMRWVVQYARSRAGKSMKEKLANELIDAANERGESVKKREDTHRMAEANKAFAHYRW
jgi:small subunit ribosomal protein S7